MNTFSKLSSQNILILQDHLDKKGLLKRIAELAAAEANFSEKEIFKALKAREQLCTTGFGNGIAIPHCQLDELKEFTLGLILCKQGIDFNSLDGKPVQVFFYIIGPSDQKNEHIRILSNASKLLSNKKFYERLLSAQSTEEIAKMIADETHEEDEVVQSSEKMLFQIATRNEELFNQFLQAAVTLEIESMVVLEGVSASNYLYKLPLFSSFWNDRAENDRKVILISVDKAHTNNLIREINQIPNLSSMEDEFMLNVIPLYYSAGKLGL